MIAEKTREVTRALEAGGAREESLSLNITKLGSTLANRGQEIENARKDVERVKEDWNKKIQRGHDKVAALEAKLKASLDKHRILKVRSYFRTYTFRTE